MKQNLTELAFILDRSGSMQPMAAAAIEGFNHFLREQQEAPGHARLTLVLFDDEYLVPVQALPAEEVLPLDHTTYIPRNSTALLDAIGRTIDELGARLAAIPEPDRPDPGLRHPQGSPGRRHPHARPAHEEDHKRRDGK